MDVNPVSLKGKRVHLEPLSLDHTTALCAIGLDSDLWKWSVTHVTSEEMMREYINAALDEQAKGLSLPFAIISVDGMTAAGCTRFMNIDKKNKRVEIGATWIGKRWQRTAVNTETKFLMLQHAFEKWKCYRVELKTDALNLRSREAIKRIGAVEEGTLRKHTVTATGRVRDTVYYSILDEEWGRVRDRFNNKLLQL